jgi:hypothetical protein
VAGALHVSVTRGGRDTGPLENRSSSGEAARQVVWRSFKIFEC